MPALLEESLELLCVLAALSAGLWWLVRQRPGWSARVKGRWATIVAVLAAAIVLVEVTETVLGQEGTALDRAVLTAVHDAVPSSAAGLFAAATTTGSFAFLVPVVALAGVGSWAARRAIDGLQLALTLGVAGGVVYLAKGAVQRDRPALWDTEWYWGSSFPSGHTLASAAVATAACLLVARRRPAATGSVAVLAALWVCMVAVSRLVLGVHWPTDVLAAACAGLLSAVAVDAALRAHRHRSRP